MVEFDEKQRLILHGGEQIVVPYEIENIRSSKADEIREGFAGLPVVRVPYVSGGL